MALIQRLNRSVGIARASHTSGFSSSRRICVIRASATRSNGSESDVSAFRSTLLNMTAGVAAAAVLLAGPPAASAAEPFLTATGARGPLVEQEQALYQLRVDKEGAMRAEIAQQRETLEAQARANQGSQLCATPFGIDVVGVTVFVALVGAAVGGYTARQRKAEAEKLNEQLRKINASLRQQTRAATAAGVTPPPSSSSSNGNGRSSSSSSSQPQTVTATITLPKPVISTASPAAAAAAAAKPATVQTLMSMDEDEMSAEQLACRDTLRAGKRLLKEKQGAASQANFEKALVLAQSIGERVQERRAVRGLAAACKLQGRYQEAIGYYERVLLISQAMGEFTGDADAYGSIADCYTEMDRFDRAAEFYDKYIQHMED